MRSSGFIFVNSAIVVRAYLSRIDRSRLVPDLLHLQLWDLFASTCTSETSS
jgi:hypothetical protein